MEAMQTLNEMGEYPDNEVNLSPEESRILREKVEFAVEQEQYYYHEGAVSLTDVLTSKKRKLEAVWKEYINLPRKKKKKKRNSGFSEFMKDFMKH